jgi:Ni2+-binding GTPase involved in maturation of urease and hydrogenase
MEKATGIVIWHCQCSDQTYLAQVTNNIRFLVGAIDLRQLSYLAQQSLSRLVVELGVCLTDNTHNVFISEQCRPGNNLDFIFAEFLGNLICELELLFA